MKKRKKNSYPTVKCVRCGVCCRVPVVPVTHKDLKRLVEFTGMPAAKVVRFCPFSEMEYDPESGLWISFRYGKRAMILRKKAEKCIFQTPTLSCAAYEARPQTCRTFPYNVDTDDDEELEITLNDRFTCSAAPCSNFDIDKLLSDSLNENMEDEEYHRLVRRWNKSEQNGGTKDFLKFIGF
ncbi:MAG: YkgJ family cysteine cluster protein [Chitinispirillales bacterium]|jgi:Fe-S-cluster containining protein|nr:YkgJ family cysteine cluster protein [Chitinispirillales bacterium]